jgi:hypothetical protein
MAEPEIKRVNFFDGQFLKEGELNDLSNYAVHMQRRLLFALFDQSGVVDTGSSDLAVDVPTAGQKAIRVKAGMAIGRRPDIAEAHEIILSAEVSPISLTTQSSQNPRVPVPLQANDTGIVTIHYEEEPSGNDAAHPTRIKENAIITVHRNALPPPDPAKPLVVLANVAFNTMAVAPGQRQSVQINRGLMGGSPVPQLPAVTGISPTQAVQGTTVQITITGTKLNGASGVSFDNAGLVAQNVQADPSGTQIAASLTVAADAPAGASAFTVATPSGSIMSGAVAFAVQPAPRVTAILPTTQHAGQLITVRGTNIRDSQLAVNQPANGTVIAFVDAVTEAPLAKGVHPTALADIGTSQQVQVTIAPATDWPGSPAANTSIVVKVRVTFNHASAVSTTKLTVNF